ncbi:hypothetical protein DFR55_12335 [Herbinix hemicellulosilytica]|uniref:Cyclic nucleotide-binding domain-containing protein n=1 Tax=Herbinix hemicellulosilytica TaxID=1564487 RepID=A0A0H5SLK5_HERHM|nr:cyclic nucleotide-binding domain-containing protein [Herbinix hemicellulosilytica]RBP57442.1 hypothetical protein DFR55_12335 [Herbinix hemicellulosilytica]CRZ35646.1 hypothetical protein HHT355_2460 [Herbinix hemicellulosilytica]
MQKMKLNAVNQLSKGTVIYNEGEPLNSIALLVKGNIQVYHDGARYLVGPGSFLAVNDVLHGVYQSTYMASDDVIIYLFAVEHKEDLEKILSINKDYNGFMVASLSKIIYELGQTYQGIIRYGRELYNLLTDNYKVYYESASRLGYTVRKPQWVDDLTNLEIERELDNEKIEFYMEYAKIPIDVMKSYYSVSNIITLYQIEEQSDLISQLNDVLKSYTKKLILWTEYLIDDSDKSLFGLIASHAIEIVNADGNSKQLLDILDNIINNINNLEVFLKTRLGRDFSVNRKRIEEIYHLINTGTKDKELSVQTFIKYSVEEAEKVLEELTDSYRQILDYAEIDEDTTNQMQSIMMDFINLKDKFSTDDYARKIRKQLTETYYVLYKAVFLKAYHDKHVPRIIDMFLKYGYADERLLTKDQILSLYFLEEDDPCDNVYNIKEWLTLIYEGKKEPSKNEFDQEYNEMLLSMKSRGMITDKQYNEYSTDNERKLEYEIQNMFRYNNRLTSGQISVFVPVLHKDALSSIPDKAYLSAGKIKDVLNKLLDIDFSIFDWELLYTDKSKNIEKEYIIKRVFPDIILMPTIGTNAIMWQDITGRRRGSPGRFIFPVLFEGDLFLQMVRVCGRFRWEMCRTIEGVAWNDIKYKSLTSEYSDYIQFYKKNKNLSEEKKEKIKLQIQKGRNNSREIFVIDYETWIIFESGGAIKLNKPVREILATYCPFSKKIREQLTIQPVFEEAFARFNKNRLKKIKELEGRYRMLQKDSIQLTKELTDTLDYYKET